MQKPRKHTRAFLFTLLAIVAVLLVFSLMPLPRASAANCGVVSGEILNVKAGGGPGDILVEISGHNGHFYINHGLENGVDLRTLTNQLKAKQAKVYYVKHWSLFNLNAQTRHIGRIETTQSVVYNEWEVPG